MEAEVNLDYSSGEIAKAVANAVAPDNIKSPSGLLVETSWKNRTVLTKVKCERGLPTFIATIDDLLSCVSIAEKVLLTIERFG